MFINKLLKELRKPFYLIALGVFGITYIVTFFSLPLILGVLR